MIDPTFPTAGIRRRPSVAVPIPVLVTAGLAALLAGRLPAADGPPEKPVDFARQVLPILSDKCFVCHGPDTRKKDELRLDTFEAATADRGGYRAIDPSDPEKSEVLFRLHDEDDPMPPADAEKQLTNEERAMLSRWIREGGTYAKHWAFVPPRRESPPGPTDEGNPTDGAIDAFVGDRLAEAGLTWAPEADRATLARRTALVLTGLPPEPGELSGFLTDESPDAHRRFAEAMLASPRFGEHFARYWLDAVRYGDTHGLHLDNRRGIFPYRDWVVRALNGNLPFDEFVTWQLAGDLLPSPTLEQRVATGFVRLNPSTSEGGVIPDEFQAKNNFDRTETLGTVLLGMTLSCARCHTHKYDPITQTEYYELLAFFNNTSENPLDGNAYQYHPVAAVPEDQAAWEAWRELESARDALIARAASPDPSGSPAWRAHAESLGPWSAKGWRMTGPVDAARETPPDPAAWEDAKGLPGASEHNLPDNGHAVWAEFGIEVADPRLLWLTFTGAPGSQVMIDGTPVPAPAAPRGDRGNPARPGLVSVPLQLPAGEHAITIRANGTGDGNRKFAVHLSDPWSALGSAASLAECDQDALLRALADASGPLFAAELRSEAVRIAARIDEARDRFTTTLVAGERSDRRPTRLLERGEYDLPSGDPLEPDVLSVMGAFPKDAPRNRLGLAAWLTSADHPLVSRVLINRVWQHVFGAGLVRTPEDFGLQGQQPTHPELLDWLAVEFRESGWDLKHMIRLMVNSRTFRQSSARRDGIDDPENRLLARGPSHRLDAEVLRDLGLWASGLLDPHMGGEGVKPYQPEGMWIAMAHPASNTKQYVRDHGQRLYRRSLYVYWKRTSPHPMMTLFDAPDRESSCVRRSRTNTALQSLGLLNETQRIEMARKLAERLLRGAADDDGRLNLLFHLLASRSPSAAEGEACRRLLETMTARYAEAPDETLALLSTGDAPRDESIDPARLAAWTQVAVTVLASDPAILLY